MAEKRILVFINPVLVTQRGDVLGSGIPYMPHILAYTVGLLKENGMDCRVIDAFGENPEKIAKQGDFYWQGLTVDEVIEKIDRETKIVFVYSSAITNVDFNLELIKKIKRKFPKVKIVLLGNTQAVTSFDVTVLADEFLKVGTDVVVYNNIEKTVLSLVRIWLKTKENIIYKNSDQIIKRPMSQEIGVVDEPAIPAWELFPLKNYWKLGYSHGPMQGNYLPLLTSYGCPFKCNFCVNPGINKSRWQAKLVKFVFGEIMALRKKFGVREFHVEDLDPTIDKERIKELCRLIIDNGEKIKWKIVSGTKVETIDEETLGLMEKSGCSYISVSPESGSKRVLKLMNKSFDYKHADWFIKKCSRMSIKTQACFVVGFPGENDIDRKLTETYIKQLSKLGVDEIALFIASPLPGSKIYKDVKGYEKFSDLTFSPKWRKGYEKLEIYRRNLYLKFIWWKFLGNPVKIVSQGLNLISKNFETKMEMTIYRIMKFNWFLIKSEKKT